MSEELDRREHSAPVKDYAYEARRSGTANIEPKSASDFFQDLLEAFKRLYLLPIILSVVFCTLFCVRARLTFNPIYRATATFTVNVNNASLHSSPTYSVNLAKQLSNTFPYIFGSDVLNNLIQQDLGMNEIPATIQAEAVGETNLFTINVYSRTPQTSYNVLHSAIDNYPRVADFVVGNTTLTLISESGLPQRPTNDISYKTELMKGVVVGCLVSLAVMIISVFTKTTVKDADDLKNMLNLKCLGTVPYIGRKRRGEGGMIEISDPDISRSFADSIRLLKARTQRACDELLNTAARSWIQSLFHCC